MDRLFSLLGRGLLQLVLAPFRALWWALREMGRQLVGKARSALAPLLWPAAGFIALFAIYKVGGEQALETALTFSLALGGLLYGFKLVLGLGKPKKKGGKK